MRTKTTITVNRRLAKARLNRAHKEQQREANQAWETPDILPLNTWLTRQFKSISPSVRLLSNQQETTLWKQISGASWNTVKLCQSALALLRQWNIDIDDIQYSSNESVLQFRLWAKKFIELCQTEHWITPPEIPNLLITHVDQLALPDEIECIGFDTLSPSISDLFSALEKRTRIQMVPPVAKTPSVHVTHCETTEQEIQMMANYANDAIKSNPNQTIACVVPNLHTLKYQVDRIFNNTLSDHTLYNISAGDTLGDIPIIRSAMDCLKMLEPNLREREWLPTLLSPYLQCHPTDKNVIALIDTMRRTENRYRFTPVDCLPMFSRIKANHSDSTWLKRWNNLIQLAKNIQKPRRISDWGGFFCEVLNTLKWPGTKPLSSIEYQAHDRFKTALAEFACSDVQNKPCDFQEAVDTFAHQLSSIVFQSKTPETPIQILGTLETAGLYFDRIWMMGLDDQSWPPPIHPTPFLPFDLQSRLQMPHANAEKELTFYRHLTKRIASSASVSVVFSTPTQIDDQSLSPSPLIQAYPIINFDNQHVCTASTDTLRNQALETLIDDKGPSINDTENIQGGTGILKLQALCPFSAFATYRLGATPLQTVSLGPNAAQRGQLTHLALETLWKRCQSQEQLLTLTETQTQTLISNAVENACQQLHFYQEKFFLDLERDRLVNLLTLWCEIEKQRSPFVVLDEESKSEITIGPLSLKLQIDRIDALPGNRLMIIDYKTGLTNPLDWFTTRPPEPQLPLYALTKQNVSGIAFAQVRQDYPGYKGLYDDTLNYQPSDGMVPISEFDNPDELSDWTTLSASWESSLETLAVDFHEGNATIDPLEHSCAYCPQKPFCRILEAENE